jgi:hypothetical protein
MSPQGRATGGPQAGRASDAGLRVEFVLGVRATDGCALARSARLVSLTVAPGGQGVPAPLRFSLTTHHLEHLTVESHPDCPYEQSLTAGDARAILTGPHPAAEEARRRRDQANRRTRVRASRAAQAAIDLAQDLIAASASRRDGHHPFGHIPVR